MFMILQKLDSSGSVEELSYIDLGENFVYFKACYDGAEWCEKMLRNSIKKLNNYCGTGVG